MEKENKQIHNEPTIIEQQTPNLTEQLKIGEMFLSSAYQTPEKLWQLMKKILKNKDVESYLLKLEKKKIGGGYLG